MNISRLAAAFLVALAPLVLGACAPDSGTFCNDKVCYILNFDKNVAMLVSE